MKDLANEQARLGHNVAFAGVSSTTSAEVSSGSARDFRLRIAVPLPDRPIARGGGWRQTTLRSLANIDIRLALSLAALIRQLRPAVVNTHSLTRLPPWIWQVIAQSGAGLVHTLHDYSSLCTNGSLFHDNVICNASRAQCRMVTALHRRCAKPVGALIAVGSEIAARHRQARIFPDIPEALQVELWNPIAASTAPKQPSPTRCIRFGYLGRLDRAKGCDLLIEACRELPKAGWTLTIAGSAQGQESRYRSQAGDMPISFPGPVDAERFYENIDCLIAPSVWPEAFGRTVAEALLRGIPVIGADTGGIAEQLRAWQAGLLFAPGNPAELAKLMAGVMALERPLPQPVVSPEIARRLSVAHVAQETIRLYERLLADKTRPNARRGFQR